MGHVQEYEPLCAIHYPEAAPEPSCEPGDDRICPRDEVQHVLQ